MQTAKKIIESQLSTLYSKQEIESLSKLIFEKVLGLSRLEVFLNQNEIISAANLAQIKEIIARLTQFEPIQYIFGETEFYGLILKVGPEVLVPRPETEELVDWIIHEYKYLSPNILDIGTGSGCIPIALIKNIPGASAEGWDISLEALKIAKENAQINQVTVGFTFVDILSPSIPFREEKYDIIVSNPPYVTLSEQQLMARNVTDFEPPIALFVADNEALIYYRAIADVAKDLLKPGGKIYFEINERYGNETTEVLQSKGFINIVLKKDINGKDRMVRGELQDGKIERMKGMNCVR